MADADLVRRLQNRDPTAPSDLFKEFYLDLVGWLRRRFRRVPEGVDPDLYYDAAFRALDNLVRHPERYDPGRGGLKTYLRMSAEGDLRNLLAQERRRRHLPLEVVAERLPDGKERVDESPRLELERLMGEVRLSPEERRVLDLMLRGERRTPEYARVLGLEHMPLEVQRLEVKRVKDRIWKRLRRRVRSQR